MSDVVFVSLSDTTVHPGPYGGPGLIPTFTVDQQGRLIAASNVPVTPSIPSGSLGFGFMAEDGEDGEQGWPGIPGAAGGPPGPAGPTGPTGATGSQGPQGLGAVQDGEDGLDGYPGPAGQQGPQGIPGPQGSMGMGVPGFDGDDGELGWPGLQGIQGIQGVQGPQGLGVPGIDGEDGQDGARGLIGPQGLVGPRGIPGIEGVEGEDGWFGPTGVTGARGATGAQGSQGLGVPGWDGDDGIDGVPGLQGIQGVVGATGATGATGPQGPQGLGSPGLDGEDGIDGVPGLQGATGSTGAIGLQGSQGIQGDVGDDGLDGFPGVQGPIGVQGPQGMGAPGEDGEDGFDGSPGLTGATGAQGPPGLGIPGEDGEDGYDGVNGIQGPMGVQGPQGMGVAGNDGEDGLDGWVGPAGTQGLVGPQGPQGMGVPGVDGEDGFDGVSIPGIPGPQGPPGLIGVPGLDGDEGAENWGLGAGVAAIFGTANQILVTQTTGIVTISLAGPHNVTTLATNGVLYGAGTSAIQALAVNATATPQFLTQVSSAAPAWATLTLAYFGAQVTKTFLAGPTSGADATPTFRTIAVADVPTLNQNTSGTAAGLSAVLVSTSGGTGVNNAGTLTNATATTITGGGTLALGGFTLTAPATGTAALLGVANSFTQINPLTTIAESWIGPSSTTGIYFKGGSVGIGTTSPGWPLQLGSTFTNTSSLVLGANDFTNLAVAGTHAATTGMGIAAIYQMSISSGTQAAVAQHVVFDTSGAGTVTKQAGILVRSLTKGTGNSYLVLGTDTIPTTNFGIYNAATSDNYFAGNVGIGITGPTALLHLAAGTATASTAPAKFTPGTLNTKPEIGALEFTDDGTTGHLYITVHVATVETRHLIF